MDEEEIQEASLQEQPQPVQAEQRPDAQNAAEQLTEPRKKRGRPPRQNKLVEAGAEQKGTGIDSAATKPKRSKPKKIKLTLFDKDALKLVRRGIGGAGEVSAHLGVGEMEVAKRFGELEGAGLVSRSPEEAGKLVLTVKAYNEFIPNSLETTLEEKARRKAEALQKKQAAHELKQQKIKHIQLEEQPPKMDENRHVGIIEITGEEKREKIDLQELLAKGAPRQPSFFARRMQEKQRKKSGDKPAVAVEPNAGVSPRTNSEKTDGGEKCVLCKTDFILSVSGGNPKYGHCFCGAAYHQDCYEGVLQASSECVQCGKKLDIIIDKESAEEVRKLKDVFG